MIGAIFQFRINFGMGILEALFGVVLLYIIVSFMNSTLLEDNKLPKKTNSRSSLISGLIIFGIILGIRYIFDMLDSYVILFSYLSNDVFMFAITTSIFFPFHSIFVKKFSQINVQAVKFKKRSKIIIILTWILALIFLSFDLLQIQLTWVTTHPTTGRPDFDLLYLGIFWVLFLVGINIILSNLINRVRPIDRRIPKQELRFSMIASGIVVIGIWVIQLIIFEIYLSRALGLLLIVQDIRVLIVFCTCLQLLLFINFMKVKYIPEAAIRSEKKIQDALRSENERYLQNNGKTGVDHMNSANSTLKDRVTYSLECVSLKMYSLLFREVIKTHPFGEKVLTSKEFRKSSRKIITFILWGISLVLVSISFFHPILNLDPFIDILFFSIQWAFLLVLIDIAIMLVFNKLIPVEKQFPKITLINAIQFGAIIILWIWAILLYITFLYLFVWISDILISNLVFMTISSIIFFLIGIFIVRRQSGRREWSNSFKKAFLVYLIWLVIDILIKLFVVDLLQSIMISNGIVLPLKTYYLLFDLILSLAFIFIGTPFVMKIYHVQYKKAIRSMVSVQLVVVLLIFIGTLLLGFIDELMLSYSFNIQDVRVPLVICSSIYFIFFLYSLRMRYLVDISEKEKEEKPIHPDLQEKDILKAHIIDEKKEILNVQDLTTYFYTEEGIVRAVEGVSFRVFQGEVLGLVGETGCGKSVTALSILQLVRPPGVIEGGKVLFEGEDLLQKPEKEMLKYRGKDITMIFQDPLNSINPIFKIGDQISEVFLLHMEKELLIEASKYPNKTIFSVAREWGELLLRNLNIPFPAEVYDRYPHELSGGMRQRVQIAMGIACSPKLLIADEPTTALDVTVQNQILKQMKELREKYNTSILFITHDLGVISKMCDWVAVMYSGFIVEYGDNERLFVNPYHPYTKGLIAAVPVVGKKKDVLNIIPGMVPNLIYPPSGCRFHPRCEYCFEPCDSKIPQNIEVGTNYFVACHLYDPQYKELAEKSIQNVEKNSSKKESQL